MSREYPERPILAVGAVVFNGEKVLLAQRGKQPGYGTWSIPGGAVKIGETVREAAAREVKEECGIDVVVGEVAEVIDRVVNDDQGRIQYHYVIIDFVAIPARGSLLCAASDCLEARWISPDELDSYNLTPIAAEVIAKARGLLADHPLASSTDADGAPAHARAQSEKPAQ
jgi:8-oxo-dGTP diphosphatase